MEAGLDEDEEGISSYQDQERVNLHDNEDRAITWNGTPHQNEAMDDIHHDHRDDMMQKTMRRGMIFVTMLRVWTLIPTFRTGNAEPDRLRSPILFSNRSFPKISGHKHNSRGRSISSDRRTSDIEAFLSGNLLQNGQEESRHGNEELD